MTTSDPLLLQIPWQYDQPKLKSLPLREQPAYRVSQNAAGCNLAELLAAVIGGQRQIEISQALLARFDGDIRRLYLAHPAELATVRGEGHWPGNRGANQGGPQSRFATEHSQ